MPGQNSRDCCTTNTVKCNTGRGHPYPLSSRQLILQYELCLWISVAQVYPYISCVCGAQNVQCTGEKKNFLTEIVQLCSSFISFYTEPVQLSLESKKFISDATLCGDTYLPNLVFR